jgi:hypothetical protein
MGPRVDLAAGAELDFAFDHGQRSHLNVCGQFGLWRNDGGGMDAAFFLRHRNTMRRAD